MKLYFFRSSPRLGHSLLLAAVSRANGAAAMLYSRARIDARAPDVALRALPPNGLAAPGCHHLRRQLAVERRVPFPRHVGRDGRKVVEADEDLSARTVGAALLPRCAERNAHGKGVAAGAAPPCHRGAAGRNVVRRFAAVFLRVPLLQQGFMTLCHTEVIQRLPDCRSPPCAKQHCGCGTVDKKVHLFIRPSS